MNTIIDLFKKKEPLIILGFLATILAGVYDEVQDKEITNWRLLLPIVLAVIGRQLVTPSAIVRAKNKE